MKQSLTIPRKKRPLPKTSGSEILKIEDLCAGKKKKKNNPAKPEEIVKSYTTFGAFGVHESRLLCQSGRSNTTLLLFLLLLLVRSIYLLSNISTTAVFNIPKV